MEKTDDIVKPAKFYNPYRAEYAKYEEDIFAQCQFPGLAGELAEFYKSGNKIKNYKFLLNIEDENRLEDNVMS